MPIPPLRYTPTFTHESLCSIFINQFSPLFSAFYSPPALLTQVQGFVFVFTFKINLN